MKRVEGISSSYQNQIIQEFTKIWGVGQKTAFQLYSYGYRNINEIDKSKLNSQQLIGLKYFYEFQQRIPRMEVEQIYNLINQVCYEINPFIVCQVCGSYRRGKQDSGDVDILITLKQDENDNQFSSIELSSNESSSIESNELITINNINNNNNNNNNHINNNHNNNNEKIIIDGLLQKIVTKLEEMKIITDTLSISCKIHLNQDENDTFMGVYYLPQIGIHRRIDIKVYRREHFAFALLYFTGSDHFNRSLRLLCRKKGYSLSDKSLCINTIRDSKSNRIHDGTKINCKTENDIFNFIGIPFKEPKDRDV
ncbi:predicted protein [Naegleria gruberi]|uniref:DNA polymerase n=1 Tax=Naegleria gruberi TaxID=5762 RepID=D2V1V6_NAEGR|nr:uncharacterized protein NAEGRDRAFT_62711 [Naegleria gruberi]EFC49376.1 predicted protein [Naegleria gruberi]|eukprot:XP_002682120.1 predicted protein [Naegleria gruberi strain NEG-M]